MDNRKRSIYTKKNNITITGAYLLRMDKPFEWIIIKGGDTVVIKNFDNLEATVIDTKNVEYINQQGEKVTGWSTIRIYDWAMIKGNEKTLHEMRQEKLISLKSEIE